MQKNMNVVILAAGKGSRMRSSKPKVLHQIAGKALIFHVLDLAQRVEPDNIFLVLGHAADQVRAEVEQHYQGIRFVIQEEQLGTAHALQVVTPDLPRHGRVLVLYGDVPFVRLDSIEKLLDGGSQTLKWLSAELDDPSGYGRIVRDYSNKVIAIVEESRANSRQRNITEVNSGIFVAPLAYLQHWLPRISNKNANKEFLLTDVVNMAHHAGIEISIEKLPEERSVEIRGVNNLQQLTELERHWQLRKVKDLAVNAGVRFTEAQSVVIRGELSCGIDVFIDYGCVFEGKVELGDGVKVGPNCFIRASKVAEHAVIEAFCHLDGASVGPNAQVGPYARLRPGAKLGASSKVGNFVELKQASLGNGSKVNHLSYIGDAEIGSDANIGAGTITCNYDGKQKSKTSIASQAFIGSNSSLVAPVSVGANAYVGAGSTITGDIPDDHLGLARARQVNLDKKNWRGGNEAKAAK